MGGTDTVNFVYSHQKSSVKVNYYDENGKIIDKDAKGNKVNPPTLTGYVGDSYDNTNDSNVTNGIYGYQLIPEKTTGDTKGTFKSGSSSINYYYKRSTSKFNYQKYDVTNGKHDKVTNSQDSHASGSFTGNVGDKYDYSNDNDIIKLSGYTLKTPLSSFIGNFEENDINMEILFEKNKGTVNYSYIDTDGNSLKDDKGNKISKSSSQGYVGYSYPDGKQDVSGYTFDHIEGDQNNGNYADGTLNLKYVYQKRKTSQISVHYRDEDGNPITDANGNKIDDYIGQGYVGDTFTVPSKSIYGYEFENYKNLFGIIGPTITIDENLAKNDITAIYKRQSSSVNVLYQDMQGKNIDSSKNEIINGYVGDNFMTKEKSFDGYRLKEVQGNKEGKIDVPGSSNNTVKYIYQRLDPAKITIKYQDMNGNQIKDDDIINGYADDPYKIEPPQILGYKFTPDDDPLEVSMKAGDTQIVLHYDVKDNELSYIFKDIYFTSNGPNTGGDFLSSYRSVDSNLAIEFLDKISDKQPISVLVRQDSSKFSDGSNNSFDGELYYQNGAEKTSILNNDATIIDNKYPSENYYWDENHQILLKNNNLNQTFGNYKTPLTWTIKGSGF